MSANALRKLKNGNLLDATVPKLFIHQDFHSEAFHDSEVRKTLNNIIRKVRNNLIFAFNRYPNMLPEYIIIVLNNHYMHDEVFVDFELKGILKKVFNEVNRLISVRRDQLPKPCITKATEVFVTRPLPKPAFSLQKDYKFKAVRRKVNGMLDALSRTLNFTLLNVDEITCSQKALFTDEGKLSDFGRERFWVSISEFIRKREEKIAQAINKATVRSSAVATQTDEQIDEYHTAGRGQTRYSDHHSRYDSYHREFDRQPRRDRY